MGSLKMAPVGPEQFQKLDGATPSTIVRAEMVFLTWMAGSATVAHGLRMRLCVPTSHTKLKTYVNTILRPGTKLPLSEIRNTPDVLSYNNPLCTYTSEV